MSAAILELITRRPFRHRCCHRNERFLCSGTCGAPAHRTLHACVCLSLVLLVAGLSFPAACRGDDPQQETIKPLLEVRGFGNKVRTMTLSSKGEMLAVVDDTCLISVYGTHDGRRISRFPTPGETVTCLAFDPRGESLATGSDEGVVSVWDVAKGTHHSKAKSASRCYSVTFSPDSTKIAAGCYGPADPAPFLGIQLSSVEGQVVRRIRVKDVPMALRYSPAGIELAAAGQHLYILNTNDFTLRKADGRHSHGTSAVEFVRNGRLVASGATDHRVRIWDASALGDPRLVLHEVEPCGCLDRIFAMAYRQKQEALMTFSMDGYVRYWNVSNGRLIRKMLLVNNDEEDLWDTGTVSTAGRVVAATNRRTSICIFGID